MSNTEKNLQAALAKFSELSKKGIGKARESLVHSSNLVKGRIDINSLQREKKKLISELGEDVFTAIDAGKLRTKLFDDLIGNIRDVSAKIEEKEKELKHSDLTAPETSSKGSVVEKAKEKETTSTTTGDTEKEED